MNTAFLTLFTKFAISATYSFFTDGVLDNIKTIVRNKMGVGGTGSSFSRSLRNYFNSINFYGGGGLLVNIHYVFLANAIIGALNTVLDPSFLYRLYLRRRELKKGLYSELTQEAANK